jgi:hypothetical protein
MRVCERDAFFRSECCGDLSVPLRVVCHVTFVVNVNGDSS